MKRNNNQPISETRINGKRVINSDYTKYYYDNLKKNPKKYKRHINYVKNWYRKKYKELLDVLGSVCLICNSKPLRLTKHEINGLKHKEFTPKFYKDNIGKFILLCHPCHKTFHVLINYNYTFEEILKILRWEEVY